jgi:hypothetical protein
MVSMQQQEEDIRNNMHIRNSWGSMELDGSGVTGKVGPKGQYVPWWDLHRHDYAAGPHTKDNAHPAKDTAWDMLWNAVQGRFMSAQIHERVAGAVDKTWRTWTHREQEYYAHDQFNPYNLATAIFDGAGRFEDPFESSHHRMAEAIVFWTLFYKEFKNWAHYKGYPGSNEKFYNLAFEMHRKGQHDT